MEPIYKTHQEIFDKVATHLLTQREKSVLASDPGQCAYRGMGGFTCAAGCLIPDELLPLVKEGKNWSKQVPELKGQVHSEDCEVLVCALQSTHDDFPVEKWYAELIYTAKDFKLDTARLKSLRRPEDRVPYYLD